MKYDKLDNIEDIIALTKFINDKSPGLTQAEMICEALRIYKWYLTYVENNNTIRVIDPSANVIFELEARYLASYLR